MNQQITALLFDLGGVVFNIDFGQVFSTWSTYSGVTVPSEQATINDAAYQRHERGEINAAQYFESLRQRFDFTMSDAEFTQGWQAIFLEEVEGMHALLQSLRSRMPVYAFSNSNRLHQQCWSSKYASTLDLFEEVFVSSDLGVRKPDAQAFTLVADLMGVNPREVLFFDDSTVNVAGARRVGMQCVKVDSISDIEQSVASILAAG